MVLVPSDDAEEDVLKDKGEEIREELEPGASAKENENENRTEAKRYELYADVSVEAYDRIRLSKTMLSDHFLPKYIEALEDVRARMEAEKKSGTKTETGLL
jgi:alpha-galactosidase/6-phospho-beta-glucosidase family protein